MFVDLYIILANLLIFEFS